MRNNPRGEEKGWSKTSVILRKRRGETNNNNNHNHNNNNRQNTCGSYEVPLAFSDFVVEESLSASLLGLAGGLFNDRLLRTIVYGK